MYLVESLRELFLINGIRSRQRSQRPSSSTLAKATYRGSGGVVCRHDGRGLRRGDRGGVLRPLTSPSVGSSVGSREAGSWICGMGGYVGQTKVGRSTISPNPVVAEGDVAVISHHFCVLSRLCKKKCELDIDDYLSYISRSCFCR